jgi:uncharacterized protein YPO0396
MLSKQGNVFILSIKEEQMSHELTARNQQETPASVRRSKEEIDIRIANLNKHIERNNVWIHRGYDKIPEPTADRLQEIFSAKLNEFKWLLGEDVEVTDGISGAG